MSISFRVNPSYARMDEVLPGLFISGVSELSPSTIEKNGITFIINATNEVPNFRSLSNVQRTKLWLEDTPQTYIYPHLELQADQIAALLEDKQRVLVHCVAGVSRSASIILAYLTKYRFRSLRAAYHHLKSIRPLVRPNLGFWRQLIMYEQATKGLPPSVRLVRDDAQIESEQLLPDVYFGDALRGSEQSSSPQANEPTERRPSNGDRPKFKPVLAPLPEIEAA